MQGDNTFMLIPYGRPAGRQYGRAAARPYWAGNIVMSGVFLLFAAFQYNDPDPLVWMTIYGMAAASSILALRNRLPWFVPLLIAVGALLWAISLSTGVIGKVSLREILTLSTLPAAEEGREMLGLLIVVVWMAILAAALRNPKRWIS